MKNKVISLISAVLLLILVVCIRCCQPKEAEMAAQIILAVLEAVEEYQEPPEPEAPKETQPRDDVQIPVFSGEPFVAINGNIPFFREEEYTTESYESFSELDELGRCGMVMACIGQDLMPTEDRESISHVKPSGWIQGQYDFVDGKSLYNRCHLIGFQLAGENANEKNLITGTRYMNTIGMLPFENMVADYIKETGNHVMYRVTPVYDGDNLVASGVQMEGYSVEDEGDGIFFNVYAYNVQPGVEIDYASGENQATAIEETGEVQDFVLNTSSKKFHLPDCNGLRNTKEENKQEYEGTREMLLAQGYEACKSCNP